MSRLWPYGGRRPTCVRRAAPCESAHRRGERELERCKRKLIRRVRNGEVVGNIAKVSLEDELPVDAVVTLHDGHREAIEKGARAVVKFERVAVCVSYGARGERRSGVKVAVRGRAPEREGQGRDAGGREGEVTEREPPVRRCEVNERAIQRHLRAQAHHLDDISGERGIAYGERDPFELVKDAVLEPCIERSDAADKARAML
eukprot:5912066-Prymnesium_polylepis.1